MIFFDRLTAKARCFPRREQVCVRGSSECAPASDEFRLDGPQDFTLKQRRLHHFVLLPEMAERDNATVDDGQAGAAL